MTSLVQSFLVGTFSSLFAMVLAFILVRWRWPVLLGRISASRLFGHGVAFCYHSQDAAEREMSYYFRQSKTVSVLCMRAYSVTEPGRPFHFLIEDRDKALRLLVADPGDDAGDNPEIARRAKDYPGARSPETYRRGVCNSVDAARAAMRNNRNIQCRLHRMPPSFRAYITDDRAYVSFFAPDITGANLPVTVVLRSSPLYAGITRFFDAVWTEHSRDSAELQYA